MRDLSFSMASSAAAFFCVVLVSAHPFTAQTQRHRQTVRLQLPTTPSFSERSGGAQTLFAHTMPLAPWVEPEHKSPVSFLNPAVSYRVPVNFDLLAPEASGTPVSWTTNKPLGRFLSAWAKSAPNYFAVHPDAINQCDDLEHYTQHVPLVGGIVLHVLQQSKAHPRLTRVFEVIQPQF